MPADPAGAEATRLLWAGFRGLDAEAVDLGFRPGGLVLFARNLDPDPRVGPARCHALLRALQARWGGARILPAALDQEGGAVSRLKVWVGPTPDFRTLWERGGPEACRRWGALWARGLALLGFHVDFAPVADLFDPDPACALQRRAPSGYPREAARAAGAFLNGLEDGGVRGCLKHFPGLGGTVLDSHLGLPALEDPERVARGLESFRMLAHPDRLVMVAHLRVGVSGDLPASLFAGAVRDNPWGIRARWIPDDLEMGGCAAWDWETRVQLCLEAGHQALLVCQTPEGVQACAEAAARMPEGLWRGALARFDTLRAQLRPAADAFDRDAWAAWVAEVRRAAEAMG